VTGDAVRPRGRLRTDLLYLGWRPADPLPDPGPPPLPPPMPALAEVSPDWLAAQRREHVLLARPAWIAGGTGTLVSALGAACWLGAFGPPGLAAATVAAGLVVAGASLRSDARSRTRLRAQLATEGERVGQIRAVQQAQHAARTAEHASRSREWQQRQAEATRRPGWRPAVVPVAVDRIDVAGGTLRGWTALLTMLAAPRLAAGAEVTVLDLTEGAVAADLLALAAGWGIRPLVYVLPDDLPRLDLGLRLPADSLADVLALTAAAVDPGRPGPADPARDAAMLAGLLDVLGPEPAMADLLLALRTLAQLGGPRPPASEPRLRPEQLAALSTWSGRAAEQLVVDRAWTLAARLRVLGPLGSAVRPQPPSPLRIAATGRRGPAVGNQSLGAYLAIAMTEVLRQAPAAPPWQQTVCLLGADRLPGDVLDRLCDAAEAARAGLVLGYRSVPAAVRERLGRGHAAVAFMRLGNAEEARAAAEQIGTAHRFVLSQLTDTIGSSLTDTIGDSYTSTVGTADSVSDSVSASLTTGRSRGQGRSRPGGFAPFGDSTGSASRDQSASVAVSDSRAITEGINASTSWGWSTSRAVGANSSLAGSLQRSRELVVEQHELQHLPQTAVLLCQDGPAGREVVLADANPAIMTLPGATLAGAAPRPVTWPATPPRRQRG
jgi:hypothetical protein